MNDPLEWVLREYAAGEALRYTAVQVLNKSRVEENFTSPTSGRSSFDQPQINLEKLRVLCLSFPGVLL
jgi:hypothetical protein